MSCGFDQKRAKIQTHDPDVLEANMKIKSKLHPRIRAELNAKLSVFEGKCPSGPSPWEGATKIKIKSVLKYSWDDQATRASPHIPNHLGKLPRAKSSDAPDASGTAYDSSLRL